MKALHHYHKIGLLTPCETTPAGYRLYGTKELERLQQILLYRELDFPLSQIKVMMQDEPGRLGCLLDQRELLQARRQRLDRILSTLEQSITLTRQGEVMNTSAMFQGLNKAEWTEALAEQKEYLKEKVGADVLDTDNIDVARMNEMAAEAQRFLSFMSQALVNGWTAGDERVHQAVTEHITFLNAHGVSLDATGFLAQQRFFVDDDFHRSMLESRQTGLCYYLCVAAEKYAGAR